MHVNDTPDYVKYTYADNETATVNGAEKKTDRVTATYAARNQTATPEVAESVSDKFGNLIKTSHNETVQFENEYDAYGNVIRASDKITGETFNYSYDSLQKVTSVERKTGAQLNCIEEYSYNAEGQIVVKSVNGGSYPHSYEYEYEDNSLKRLKSINYNGNFKAELKYDLLGRTAGREITFPNTSNDTVVKQKVTYIKHGDKATNLPCKVEYLTTANDGITSSENIRYAYDKRGNIEKVYKNGKLTQRYKYDSLNRLIREDNREFKKTYLLAYDENGNIISKRSMTFNLLGEEHIEERFDEELAGGMDINGMPISPTATEEVFSYDGDKLVKCGGNSFTYDKLGCPSSYNGYECEWSFGKLKRFGETNFTYDGYGRRIGKNGATFKYDTDGKLISRSGGDGSINFIYYGNEIIGIDYNSDIYYFRKDCQGNVIEVAGGSGGARYIYDAWGNCKIIDAVGNDISQDMTNIGYINPIRYRGYYYDTETNLYYLNTRYYDPTTGRFISPDSLEYLDPETINGLNLYAYCGNNPVMNIDPNGSEWWNPFTWDWAAIGRFIGGAALAMVGFSVMTSFLIPALVSPALTNVSQFGLTVGMYGAFLMGAAVDSTVYSDMEMIGWNPFNTNADDVVNSQKVSFYKGVPYIRYAGQSGSFGLVLLDNSINNSTNAETVKHEYGHTYQLRLLGIIKYGVTIGIPSSVGFGYTTIYSSNPYEAPWEASADIFGGANHKVTKKARAFIYLWLASILGSLVYLL